MFLGRTLQVRWTGVGGEPTSLPANADRRGAGAQAGRRRGRTVSHVGGYPSFLWLKEGEHTIALYKGGYRTFEEKIEVRRGMQTKLQVRLEKGESAPPAGKPGLSATPAEPARPAA
jgi:hypothetical protein